ncbi:MAG: hypothetical protein HYR76_11225 [Ignavibacteria bacterium]|nr:hypothetical protein [Ignavibacteria bacterium]
MDFSQFFSDVLATVIGAGLALWGPIWLDRKTHSRDEMAKDREKQKRAGQVLSLISQELQFNSDALRAIDDNVQSTYRQTRVETWQALSDGGELKPIDDPELLGLISTAYANISHFAILYNKFFDMKFFPKKNAYDALKDILRNHAMKAKEDSSIAVNIALGEISKKLPKHANKSAD